MSSEAEVADLLMGQGVAAAISQYVVWRDRVKCEVVPDGLGNNTLRRSVGPTAWDAGAVSTAQLDSGDGWVETICRRGSNTDPVNQETLSQMIGLSTGDADQSYGDIDFALAIQSLGRVFIYESGGAFVSGPHPISDGQAARVEVSGGAVLYKVAGITVYTSLVSPVYPLLVDTSLFDYSATTYLRAAAHRPRISAEEGDDWSIAA